MVEEQRERERKRTRREKGKSRDRQTSQETEEKTRQGREKKQTSFGWKQEAHVFGCVCRLLFVCFGSRFARLSFALSTEFPVVLSFLGGAKAHRRRAAAAAACMPWRLSARQFFTPSVDCCYTARHGTAQHMPARVWAR